MLRITYDGGELLDKRSPQVKGLMNWYLQRYLMNFRSQFRLDTFGKLVLYGSSLAIGLLVLAVVSETVGDGSYLLPVYLLSSVIAAQVLLFSLDMRAALSASDYLPKQKVQLEDNIVDVPWNVKIELVSYLFGGTWSSRQPSVGAIYKDGEFYTIKKDGAIERCPIVVSDKEERYFLAELTDGKPYSIVDLIYDKAKK